MENNKTSIFTLKDKVILITGGYGFLGREITMGLIKQEAKVYVLGRDVEKFSKAFSQEVLNAGKLFFQQCNVMYSNSIIEAFSEIYNIEGKIDVLINNAFYSEGQSPELLSDEDWQNGIEGTLGNVFKCIREIIPFFKKMNQGKIINVSSMYGIVSPDFNVYIDYPEFLNPPHYGAAKAGVIQLTKYYASFLGKMGITVNTISPGPFPSSKVKQNEAFINELQSRTCLNRIGKPEDLVGAFVFLASEASDFITGQNIIIDGGWTIR
jgi:gluconate 5-dehydrogenase